MMQNLVINWLLNHRQWLEGIALGYAAANIPLLVGIVFHQVIQVPILRQWILSDPVRAKKTVDLIAQELDKDIDKESAAQNPPKA